MIVKKKRAFGHDGLFHIIYAEEPTNFLLTFEDSKHSLVSNPASKIHMKKDKWINFLSSIRSWSNNRTDMSN